MCSAIWWVLEQRRCSSAVASRAVRWFRPRHSARVVSSSCGLVSGFGLAQKRETDEVEKLFSVVI